MLFHIGQEVEVLDRQFFELPPHEKRVWRRAKIIQPNDVYGDSFVVEFPDKMKSRGVYDRHHISGCSK